MVGRGPVRADRADRGVHLARGGAAPALQHELQRRADPQVLGAALPGARARDGAGRRFPPGRQHPSRDESRPDGRVPLLRRGGAHHRGRGRVPHPGRRQGDLAAVRHRGPRRRHRAPGGRLHPARRPHPGVRAGRPRSGGRDPPAHEGDRDRAHRRRGVAGAHGPGRHRVRARGERHREPRPPDRRDGRARHPRHSGRAPVPRHRAAPGHRRPPRAGASGDGRPPRVGCLVLPPGGAGRSPPRTVRSRRPRLLRRRSARRLRERPLPRGPRAPRAAHRGGHPPRPRVRGGRAQAGRQRTHPLHPGRQPSHRPRLGRAQLLAQRGPQLRRHRRGRSRLADRGVDGRRRAVHRHDGASTRAASGRMPRGAIFGPRTRRHTPTSSPSTTRTRSARPAGRSSRRRVIRA